MWHLQPTMAMEIGAMRQLIKVMARYWLSLAAPRRFCGSPSAAFAASHLFASRGTSLQRTKMLCQNSQAAMQ